MRAGLGRRRAALLTGAAAVVLGGWLASTAVIAGHGWYRTLPWFPVAVTGYLGLLLALRRIPVVARALAAPGMVSRLELPHAFRVVGGLPVLPGPWSPAGGGASLARLPRCAGRAETVAGDLEFVLAAEDQVPPGLMRAA